MSELSGRVAVIVVWSFAAFLLGLSTTIVLAPSRAERFLLGFASSARTHYAEQAVRLLVGAAIVHVAQSTGFPGVFTVFGWAMLVSTVGLLLIPWQWHHNFAARVMPPVLKQPKLFALGSLALATFIVVGMSGFRVP